MSHYFLCSQNKDSINNRFVQLLISDFVVADFFPKTPSPKPARIPPQTPPAGGKSAEAGRIHSPRQIVSPCLVRIEAPPPARILGGQNTKEKCPFLFKRNWSRANQKSKEHFSLVSAEALRGGGGADSFVQFPLEKSSRKVYNYSTCKGMVYFPIINL